MKQRKFDDHGVVSMESQMIRVWQYYRSTGITTPRTGRYQSGLIYIATPYANADLINSPQTVS